MKPSVSCNSTSRVLRILFDDAFFVRSAGGGRADSLMAPVRAAIARVDRDQLVSVRDVMTLEDVMWEATPPATASVR